jgi:sulfate permease, SulP family
VDGTDNSLRHGIHRLALFRGIPALDRTRVVRDVLAGVSLAAMNVPQVLGYTRIAGTPVVTGLYTLLLPPLAFATFGSSRYLVVAADSATAAILAGGLSPLAQTDSGPYVAMAAMVALLTAGALLLARLFRLGFLADFLSQTVLVGFLTGVGFQVGIAMLGEMLGVPVESHRTVRQLVEVVHGLPHAHLPTCLVTVAVIAIVWAARRTASRVPGPLVAVVAAIAASAQFDFAGHGIVVIQRVTGGLPPLGIPQVSWDTIVPLLAIAGSCFLVIITQSAATARAYALRHHDQLDENADLVGLSAANAVAALSGTFVVNGSPTQTAMVESAGGRSQVTHLAMAAIVALVLLLLTDTLSYLPQAVLGALVFVTAIGLVDLRGLRHIRRESPGEFRLAVVTAAVVVLIGVEQGILLAIALSLLRHVRHSYRPHTAVLVEEQGQWRPLPAAAGAVTAPGLVVFQFGADLFYANAERFATDVRVLVEGAAPPIKWLVLDAGAITGIDYSAGNMLRDLHQELLGRGTLLLLAHVTASLRADLTRHRLSDVIGTEHIFDTLHEALAAIREERVRSAPMPAAAQIAR